MQSAGDWKPEQQECSFAAMGGNKGLFAKELEVALLERRIDIAIHSAKDLETVLATGLTLACFLPRDDVRDAFIAPNVTHWRELPAGARVGTSSLRRAVQVLADRPDLVIAPLRGNVDTRLRKLRDGQVDATLLALCGLQRLGLADDCFHPLPTDVMLPAVAQGALAVEMRDEPGALYDLLRRLNCGVTERCVTLSGFSSTISTAPATRRLRRWRRSQRGIGSILRRWWRSLMVVIWCGGSCSWQMLRLRRALPRSALNCAPICRLPRPDARYNPHHPTGTGGQCLMHNIGFARRRHNSCTRPDATIKGFGAAGLRDGAWRHFHQRQRGASAPLYAIAARLGSVALLLCRRGHCDGGGTDWLAEGHQRG